MYSTKRGKYYLQVSKSGYVQCIWVNVATSGIKLIALFCYTLQLEDDVIASAGFVSSIISYANGQSKNWFVIYFSKLGFIGKSIYVLVLLSSNCRYY